MSYRSSRAEAIVIQRERSDPLGDTEESDDPRTHGRPPIGLQAPAPRIPELVGTLQTSAEVHDDLLARIDPLLAVEGEPLTDEEVAQLMAFLSALTDPRDLNLFHLIPDAVPSGLPIDD